MALIGKIQEHIWIVFIFIMIALVGFLIMDAQGPGGGGPGGSGIPTEFARIGGMEISQKDYSDAVAKAQNEYLVQQQAVVDARQGNFRIDEATAFNLEDRAWTELVNERLLKDRMSKAGIELTADEFSNLIYGDDPHPYIQSMRQAFPQLGLDPNTPGATQQFVQTVQDPNRWQQFPVLEQYYRDFIMREKAVKRDAGQQKYIDLLQKASYTPQWLAARDYQMQNTRIDLDYVTLPYRDVADEEVPVTEAEVAARYTRKKGTFPKQESSRSIEYVAFDVVATPGDTQAILDRVIEYTEMWKEETDDSTFLSLYSADPVGFTSSWLSLDDLYNIMVDSALARTVFAMEPGSYSAPYKEGGYFKVAKNMGRDRLTDSTEARHIFIRHREDNATFSELRADSVMRMLNNGEKTFEELAAEYSDDDQNKTAGGILGWIVPNTPLFPTLWNYVMKSGKVNDPTKLRTQAGYHIIEITDKKTVKEYRQVSWLAQPIRPSKETDDNVYEMAQSFYEAYGRDETFDEGVSSSGYQKRISGQFKNNRYEISGLPASRAIIDWSFRDDTPLGDVQNFNLPDKYVVARLKERNEAGAPPLEQVRTQIESELINEKKAKVLMTKFDEATATDLPSLASELGTQVKSASNATFASNSIPTLGSEPEVIGKLFALTPNTMSDPIVGKQGVYVVVPKTINQAPETNDYINAINRLTSQERSRFSLSGLVNELKKQTEIVDNRNSF